MKRRRFVAGIAHASIVLSSPVLSGVARATTTITHVGFGGTAADYLREILAPAFTHETGIQVRIMAGPDLARIKAQVRSGHVEWDVVEVGPQAYAGQKEGLWEPIDKALMPPSHFEVQTPPFAVPLLITTQGIAYDPARSKPVRTFAEMFDARSFPGRRAFRDRVSENLEIALLADGVKPHQLYPLDVERAFRVLDQIKPNVKKWSNETQLMISLLQRKEAEYTYAASNRVKLASESGNSIAFSFGQAISSPWWTCVVKGTTNRQAAMQWLAYLTRPDVQLKLANKHGLASGVKGVNEKIDAAAQRWIVDFKNPNHVLVNDAYWADHYVALDRRFKEWIIS
ncbi:extracellular solute-binding protein [Burkholderia sola]|uniref:extracellular solute-binding protein n=1 Tax=Burkholderia sola TaxID=2843302 RepID=UPI0023DD6AF5|nr:extracellular solute-binding protein [Burkholderia sola]MDF3083699.1 extracellular solute-binding protein [Burkholderia sola]